jgi:hypothetical protein
MIKSLITLIFGILFLARAACADYNNQITIKGLGFKEGIILTSTDNTKQIYWKLPYNLIENDPKLLLKLSYQTTLGGANTLQVLINDIQYSIIPLQTPMSQHQQHEMKIDLIIPKNRFEEGGVNVTFRFVGSSGTPLETNVCASGNYLKIHSESTLNAQLSYNKITHFRDSLQLLSNQLTVYYPEQPDPESIRTLLQITGKLKNLGYEIQFSKLPNLHEKVILSPDEYNLRKRLSSQGNEVSDSFMVNTPQDILSWVKLQSHLTQTNAIIIPTKEQQLFLATAKEILFFPSIVNSSGSIVFDNDFIGISIPPISFEEGAKFLSEWENYFSSSKKKTLEKREDLPQESLENVSFKELNYPTNTVAFTLETNTNHLLRLLDLHKGKHIERINLSLATSKGFSLEPPIFNIYFNRELIHSFRNLNIDKVPESINLNIPQSLLRTTNTLRIQAIQQPSEGLCRFSNIPVALQVSEESHIKTNPAFSPPKNFLDVPAYFFHGFTLFLPKDASNNLNSYLPFLINLSDFVPYQALKKVVLYQGISYSHDHRPFIAIGNLPRGEWNVPLPLEQDRFRLTTPRTKQILEIKTDEMMGSMLQLISPHNAKTPYGLWIPQDIHHRFAKIKNLSLGPEDIIAFESNGEVRFTLWSTEPQTSLFQRLDTIKEDFTLYFRIATAIFWIAGIFFILHLIRKNRSRRDNDDTTS